MAIILVGVSSLEVRGRSAGGLGACLYGALSIPETGVFRVIGPPIPPHFFKAAYARSTRIRSVPVARSIAPAVPF